MATRGRPADVLVKLNGKHYKIEPKAFTGVLGMMASGQLTPNAAVETFGTEIKLGEAVSFDNIDREAAGQLYKRRQADAVKANSNDDEE